MSIRYLNDDKLTSKNKAIENRLLRMPYFEGTDFLPKNKSSKCELQVLLVTQNATSGIQ